MEIEKFTGPFHASNLCYGLRGANPSFRLRADHFPHGWASSDAGSNVNGKPDFGRRADVHVDGL